MGGSGVFVGDVSTNTPGCDARGTNTTICKPIHRRNWEYRPLTLMDGLPFGVLVLAVSGLARTGELQLGLSRCYQGSPGGRGGGEGIVKARSLWE